MAGRVENLKPFPKGVSGNPGGRPKRDLSAEIARAVFERNPDVIYRAMLRTLKKGDPRTFAILAERGYGKLSRQVEIDDWISLAERLEKARRRVARPKAGSDTVPLQKGNPPVLLLNPGSG